MNDQADVAVRPKRQRWTLVVGGVAIFLLGVMVGFAARGDDPDSNDAGAASTTTLEPTTTTESMTITTATTTTTAVATTTTLAFRPTPDDFTIELVAIERQCFGSAGANLQMEPEVTFVSNEALTRGTGTWLLIFEVDPVEDGPTVANLEIDLPDATYRFPLLILQTDSCDDEPLASITTVRER